VYDHKLIFAIIEEHFIIINEHFTIINKHLTIISLKQTITRSSDHHLEAAPTVIAFKMN